MSTDEQGEQVADRVEKDIHVATGAEEVWELVSRPGWWINDGEIDDQPQLTTEGDTTTLTHPEWGDFVLRTVTSDRPRQVAFRWASGPSSELSEAATLVTLTLEAETGGTRLRVVEEGFAALSDDAESWQAQLADNAEGWQNELRAARDFVMEHRG